MSLVLAVALPLGILAGGAGLSLLAAASQSPAPPPASRYFDPLLSAPAALCTGNGERRKLLAYYQKLAAVTETRPFTPPASGSETAITSDPPLYDNLGTLHQPITANSATAQRYFDQGLRLAFGFNHAEARRAFRAAQRHDPECAMCYWGEAFVLGPNINAPMEEEAIAPAIAAVRMAAQKAATASEREQALVAALNERYSEDPNADRAALNASFAAAMKGVAERFAQEDNLQVIYAEALMNIAPWDYWEPGGVTPKGQAGQAIAALETVLSRNPNHPGAIHYYMHMVEASAAPERALPYAQRLAAAMPGAGHIVHMPFHIYYRVGDYKAAIEANKAAVAVDEAYIAQAAPAGIYPAMYYPHNVHSLMASAQMAGDGAAVISSADKLARIMATDAARTSPLVQPILVAPFFAHAQFSPARTVLALPDPGDQLPFVKAMWHYARGVALAAEENISAARAEAIAITRLKDSDFSELTAASIPAPDILALAGQLVIGRIALAENKLEDARAAFEQAASLYDALAYSEPPHWYYPVRQSLGAVLVRLGKFEAAEDAFRTSLAKAPNNGWALFGLGEVYRRMGRNEAAAEVTRRLDEVWAGERKTLDLSRL
jgi:tetratricopeptide (TPR) repeat protein